MNILTFEAFGEYETANGGQRREGKYVNGVPAYHIINALLWIINIT